MGTIKHVFWNSEEGRVRACWRVAIYMIAAIALGLGLVRLRETTLTGLLAEVYLNTVEAAIYLLLVGVVLLGLVGSRLLDRRPLADYGLHLGKEWWLDLGVGLALGTLLMLGMFAIDLAMGWVRITGTFATANPGQPFVPAILAGFIAVVLVAVQEEVTWRAYSIKNMAEGFNWRVVGPRWATVIAVLLSAVLFGFAHADNIDATTLSTLNTMLIAVLVFSAGYVLTGELALPIGFHLAWNFVQVFVLGYYGGATRFGASVLAIAEGDPGGRLWTGMPYSHEGGLLATGASVAGFLLIVAWVRLRRGSVSLDRSIAQPPARRGISGSVSLTALSPTPGTPSTGAANSNPSVLGT